MGKPLDEIVVFDEIAISALKEVGNILAGSYLSALSTLTNLNILPSVLNLQLTWRSDNKCSGNRIRKTWRFGSVH